MTSGNNRLTWGGDFAVEGWLTGSINGVQLFHLGLDGDEPFLTDFSYVVHRDFESVRDAKARAEDLVVEILDRIGAHLISADELELLRFLREEGVRASAAKAELYVLSLLQQERALSRREDPPDPQEAERLWSKFLTRAWAHARYVQTGEKPPGPIDVPPADDDSTHEEHQ